MALGEAMSALLPIRLVLALRRACGVGRALKRRRWPPSIFENRGIFALLATQIEVGEEMM